MRKLIVAALLATSGMMASSAMATEVHITTANPVIDLTISETVETLRTLPHFRQAFKQWRPRPARRSASIICKWHP